MSEASGLHQLSEKSPRRRVSDDESNGLLGWLGLALGGTGRCSVLAKQPVGTRGCGFGPGGRTNQVDVYPDGKRYMVGSDMSQPPKTYRKRSSDLDGGRIRKSEQSASQQVSRQPASAPQGLLGRAGGRTVACRASVSGPPGIVNVHGPCHQAAPLSPIRVLSCFTF